MANINIYKLFLFLDDRNARILEILERQSWRDRVIPKEDEVQTRDDNEVPPFYYRVRWSVKGERELVPHGKLLDYCTEETLNLFSRRFCKDCGLEPGTNPETGHSCPAEIRHQTPTKRTGHVIFQHLIFNYVLILFLSL